ncbi:hypothetical protein [Streptomyces hainanensis]|uniref:hypothetical protein n=1 Tax=Streptomyces hainanensis TaxID=402648 RepID=UPI001FB58ABA|nr:hypothetical protein [Streptomyces hainanensis]
MNVPPPRDEEAEVASDVLPCGRTLSAVWEACDDGTTAADPHLAACPHCSAAVADLGVLDDFVRRERATEAEAVAEAERARATSVTDRVMDLVRRELRPGRPLPLGEPAEDLWLVESAAARTFRAVADAMPGVRAGSCRVAPVAGAGATAEARGPLRVRIEVAAGLTWTVPELARVLRERITRAARETLGLDVRVVDIAVVDVLVAADDDAHRPNGRPR